jgi:hypothetical protein
MRKAWPPANGPDYGAYQVNVTDNPFSPQAAAIGAMVSQWFPDWLGQQNFSAGTCNKLYWASGILTTVNIGLGFVPGTQGFAVGMALVTAVVDAVTFAGCTPLSN